MINIKNKEQCCGCYACYNICPKNAIEMIEDEKGFKYPKINMDKCINCGLCEKVCPILNKETILNKPISYACINKDEKIRKESSSGGIFTLLAEEIIKKGGVVFGACFDKDYNLKHDCVTQIKDLQKFRGSKYLQSSINNTYKQAKEFLDKDKYVLFTGTPCQIEGLKKFLTKDYSKLYTQDIICHGVPSPKVWNKYMEYRKKQNITRVEFRNKDDGWHLFNLKITYENGIYKKNENQDLYMQAFLKNTSLRDSCYDCCFKKKNRISDITLADFWGIEKIVPEMDDNKWTSLVIINSLKGQELFNNMENQIVSKEVEFEKAIKCNPSMISSVKRDVNRGKFFGNLDKMDFDQLVNKYTYNPNVFERVVNKLKRIIKKIIKK